MDGQLTNAAELSFLIFIRLLGGESSSIIIRKKHTARSCCSHCSPRLAGMKMTSSAWGSSVAARLKHPPPFFTSKSGRFWHGEFDAKDAETCTSSRLFYPDSRCIPTNNQRFHATSIPLTINTQQRSSKRFGFHQRRIRTRPAWVAMSATFRHDQVS